MKRPFSLTTITLFLVCSIVSVLTFAYLSDSSAPSTSRDVLFRAKLVLTPHKFYPVRLSSDTYIVDVDSAFVPTDTVIYRNERYVLLERSK